MTEQKIGIRIVMRNNLLYGGAKLLKRNLELLIENQNEQAERIKCFTMTCQMILNIKLL